ncbi:MAG: 3-oxoacyl-ACP reductase FabG [Bifidobacteriaceae bacterium]|jgi:NAD(P)-dependent dehydrogenase (short-subunit alcohol dehydrogenase family)|nr:3-oxoacyl-ACP reductase FabG [Bifidobacteriaceae bacterium]
MTKVGANATGEGTGPDGIGGQVAVVTGASRGLGHDLALAFAKAGAVVAVGARRTPDVAELARQIEADGGQAFALELDVSRAESARQAAQAVVERCGRIDILVNNAGLGFNHDALDVTEDDWDTIMDVNLRGLFFTTQAMARPMVSRGYGRVVNIGSQAGIVGIPRHAVYSASKGGVAMLTKVLALEWAACGVTVNTLAPTFIRTPGTAERLDDPAFAAQILADIPVGRFGTTADVAAAALFLASPGAGLITGVTLPVDGGWTAR